MAKDANVKLYKTHTRKMQEVVNKLFSERAHLMDDMCKAECYCAKCPIEEKIHEIDLQIMGIEEVLHAFGYGISLGWIVEDWRYSHGEN